MNTHIIHDARLVSAPRKIDTEGKTLATLRVADNPQGLKKDADPKKERRRARFTTLKAWEKQADLMLKLSKNDVITVTGELTREAYTDKDGVEKEDDVMRVMQFRVQKSDTFYGGEAAATDDDRPAETTPSGKKKSPF